ncbi:antibiotic biosynthesis monooxygenase family protein [Lacinutrix venerupis]|uniref:Antibiotic biosynthesis monooxygenase n=1 Tax=Lacinutrix venerupis TaxID=1486034 RepID=A0AAC9PVI0_9FLAO|nr:antibiotic biosynthesis monooxygenase [Lacinutrix venerupis]APX99035.1 antibiotic biosynthesis monooxygenase [Lacinutrix venerupis]
MKNFKPYYAVIFTSTRTEGDNGYSEMAELMETLAKKQTGFISIDSAKSEVGITVSYWENLEAIQLWKQQTDHVVAQQKGIKDWYSWYNVKICKVEREYTFKRMQE